MPEEADEDVEVLEELPSWLPDGWIIEVRRADNGSTYRYYTSPVSGYTFSTKTETLNYLFSEMDERVLESKARAEDKGLHRLHTWLPDGWVIEVRAGGKEMDKMYKFYVHMPTGTRFFSKEDVLRYANEGEISRCDVKGLCDTSSEDNILAQVEFNPDGLPEGWVKETIFRKCNDGIRKDPYFTDPASHHVFRTMKSVMGYLETGEITKHAYIPRRSVTDMYSFDKCIDMPQSMLKRLKVQGKTKQESMSVSVLGNKLSNDELSNHSERGTSASLSLWVEPEQKKFNTIQITGKRPINSESTKRPRGSPQKIMKQTYENSSDCGKSLHREAHIVMKKELEIGGAEHMPKESTLEYSESEKHAIVTQESDSKNITGRNLSPRKREKLVLVTDTDLHEQELSVIGDKLVCSSVRKVYIRRSGKCRPGLKKE